MKSLFLFIITIFIVLLIPKVQALQNSKGYKNFFNIIFILINIKKKLILLPISCLTFLRKVN